MLSYLSPTREAIVRALLASKNAEGKTLGNLAHEIGLRPPSVLAQLRKLVADGLIERIERPRPAPPSYKARHHLRVVWLDPETKVISEWTSGVPVSWKYPLVSRVPDGPAQAVLVRFLPQLEERVVRPLVRQTAGPRRTRQAPPKGIPAGLGDGETAESAAVTLIVYGSCARGEARPASDLDLLLVQPPRVDVKASAKALAAEANLWAPRKIDLQVVGRTEFRSLPVGLVAALRREGITVFSTFPGGEFVETVFEER